MAWKWKADKPLLYSYVVSFAGIFLLTYFLIGALLLEQYVGDLGRSYQKMEDYKVVLAEGELEAQLEIVNEMRYKIGSKVIYYPFYFADSEIKKIEMMEQFSLYQGTSLFLQEYFLFYPERGEVYTSDASRYDSYSLLKKIWKVSDAEAVTRKLEELHDIGVLKVEEERQEYLWFCFPIRMYTTSQDAKAILVCKIEAKTLLSHVIHKASFIDDNISILYNGQLVASTSDDEIIQSDVFGEDFQIIYNVSLKNYLVGSLSIFKSANLIILLVVLLVLFGISFQMAYYHSKDIRNVGRKINDKLHGVKKLDGNELRDIEEMFEYVYEENQSYSKQLNMQLTVLKKYLILSLIEGKYDENIKKHLEMLYIDLEDKHLSVLRICDESISETKQKEIASSIEQLSDTDIHYYAEYDENRKEIVVIMALTDDLQCIEGIEMVRELILTEKMDGQLKVGTVYQEISQIVNSYLEATNYENSIWGYLSGESKENIYDGQYVEKIGAAIRAGNFEVAYGWFRKLIDKSSRVDSMLMQQYMMSDVLSMLMRAANQLQVTFSSQQFSDILMSQKLSIFSVRAEEMIENLCKNAIESKQNDKNNIMIDVKNYLQEHFLDSDLTMENVADKFGLSPNYFSYTFKQNIGNNYKEYIIRLRIDYAMTLLLQGESVADVSVKVGYANVSHFIKVFKKQTGMTPSSYKKQSL